MVQLTPNLGLIKPELTDSMPDWADQNDDNCVTLDDIIVSSFSSYVPVWTATTTNPTLGNGTLSGNYLTFWPNMVYFSIRLTIGSTTAFGSGNYRLSLPFAVHSIYNDFMSSSTGRGAALGRTALHDASSNTNSQTGTVSLVSSTEFLLSLEEGSSIWSASVPFTLATSDRIGVYGIYARAVV